MRALAAAAGDTDVLDDDVVRSYGVCGDLLHDVDVEELLETLRRVFTGQVTGLLDAVPTGKALAHHSFHVFVVYPWVRFLVRDRPHRYGSCSNVESVRDSRIRRR